jgi:lipoprotein-releasing system permease protein
MRQTLLTLGGVMLGTSAFVVFAGIMTGFQSYIIDQLVNNDAHVKVSVREDLIEPRSMDRVFFPQALAVRWISPPSGRRDSARIDNPSAWMTQLRIDPRVQASAPQAQAQVLMSRGRQTVNAQLIGTDVLRQVRVSSVERYMKEGRFTDIGSSGNRVVLGDGLLAKLGSRVGESILIASGLGRAVPFRIVGTFHFGIINLDNSVAYASLGDVQSLSGRPSVLTNLAVRLIDVTLAQQVADDWQAVSNDKVQSWDEANAGILSVFSLQNFIRGFVTVSIMIVAAFGIYNILNILVNQKRRDIGILRSIGFTSGDVVKLFLIQGLALGVTGGALGVLMGFLGCLYLSTLKIGGMTDRLIVSFSPTIYLMGLGMAVSASVVSSALPAREAGRLRPIDILRSGE